MEIDTLLLFIIANGAFSTVLWYKIGAVEEKVTSYIKYHNGHKK